VSIDVAFVAISNAAIVAAIATIAKVLLFTIPNI